MLVAQIPRRARAIVHDAIIAFRVCHQPRILHRVEETFTIVRGVGLRFSSRSLRACATSASQVGYLAGERRMAVGGWIGLPGRQTTVSLARDLGGFAGLHHQDIPTQSGSESYMLYRSSP